jgi:GxxExxY protein
MGDMDHEDISFEARKALEEVYSLLGPGFDEEPYKRAFAQELTRRNIPFESGKRIPITYKGATVGEYTLDFVVRDKLFVRVAAEGGNPGLLKAQVASCIKAAKLKAGLLIDMNAQSFKLHQVLNPDFVLGAGGGATAETDDMPERLPRQERRPKGSDALDKLFGDR